MNELEIEIDLSSNIEIEIDFPDIIVGASSNIQIRNSDNTFTDIATSLPYTVPDNVYKVYVNGVLNQTVSGPSLKNQNINITA